MKMTGAQMIAKALEKEGVEYVFGIPGGAVIPLFDALYDAPFKVVLTRHEQAACHAADGYARTSGKVGVCVATSGPGATNIMTGLANAHMDSVPLVVITGQVATGAIGTDAFQEADIYGCSLPLVKHSFLVRSIKELPSALKAAFIIASTRRPGPVLVDVPVDVQRAIGTFEYPEGVTFPGYDPTMPEETEGLKDAVAMLEKSERPVILAGGGCNNSSASKWLIELAKKADCPVATTLMGKGSFPETDPLALGMAGMHGTPQANMALTESDLILAIGTRFSDRTTGDRRAFAPKAKVIHIDIDAAELGKNIKAHLPIRCHAELALKTLFESMGDKKSEARKKWLSQIEEAKRKFPPEPTSNQGVDPREAIRVLRSLMGQEEHLVTEVGQHQMWAALHWKALKPRTFITSGGLGTMGFGIPAAIGVAFAHGGKPVTCLSGDGSFFMNMQELETCARYNLPVHIVVLNNCSLGMVRQWQELFWNERYASTCVPQACSIAEVAKAMGFKSWVVKENNDLESTLKEALEHHGPTLVECMVPTQEKVFPMVPPGGKIGNFLYPENK